MLAAFIAGIAFAVGHHFFYLSLDGTIVDHATFDQQINVGVGTAFAFLVRSFLVLAVGTAFVQVLWGTLLNKQVTISRIDSATQLLTSLWDLFNLKTIWQHPVLGFLAIVSWTLPFAAIVPPATLSVKTPLEPQLTHDSLDLSYIDFTGSSLVKLYGANPPSSEDLAPNQVVKEFHGGSSDSLTQLAFGVAFQAEIPLIKPPSLNSSYTTNFFGPSIQCTPTDQKIMEGFDEASPCDFYKRNGSNDCAFDYTYLAWVPVDTEQVPLSGSSSTGLIDFTPNYDGSGYGLTTSGAYQGQPTTLYIGTQDNNTWSVLNCSLFNASYTVAFDNRDGTQVITADRELLNSLPFINLVSRTMEADISGYPPAGETVYMAAADAISYQAIMDSFGQIMVGGMMYAVSRTAGGNNVISTSILRTRLRNCLSVGGNDTSVCPSLAEGAQELFQNITLSVWSQSNFTTVNSSRFPATDVTLYTYPNTYVYTWRRLVLAYGLAILFAAVAVIIGGLALLRSGESYSYTFSSIVRTTRHKALDKLVRPEDRGGQDPRPKHIGEAVVVVGQDRTALADIELKTTPDPVPETRPQQGEDEEGLTARQSMERDVIGAGRLNPVDGNPRSWSPISSISDDHDDRAYRTRLENS